MERRRLAVILSHLSLNTSLSSDKSESHGSGDNETCSVAVDSHVCNGEDKAGVENVQNVEESSSCAVSMAEVKGLSKSEFNLKDVVHDGAVRSQMTRSQEIVNEYDDNCVFCDIIRGRAPAFKLYEDDTCLCIFDINPLSQGHSLIIPKTHFSSLEVTPPAVAAAMCAIVPLLGNAIMRATCCGVTGPRYQMLFICHMHAYLSVFVKDNEDKNRIGELLLFLDNCLSTLFFSYPSEFISYLVHTKQFFQDDSNAGFNLKQLSSATSFTFFCDHSCHV